MRRVWLFAPLVLVVIVAQYTLVNRLALPGGAEPDLVLLLVVGLGLWLGPAAGCLAGFGAGLAMDLAPPASHPIGELALIFCLVGYGSGRLVRWRGHSVLRLLVACWAGVVAGEALQAAFGLATGDPEVTPAGVARVLPAAIGYDLLVVTIAAVPAAMLARRAAGAATLVPASRTPVARSVRVPPPRSVRPPKSPPQRPVRVPPPRTPDLHPHHDQRPVRLPARTLRARGSGLTRSGR